jgi:Tfp pilus assembly protein PilV
MVHQAPRRLEATEAGFTILDVLMAILIMTIAVTGLSAMQLISLTASARAWEIAVATQLCQNKVEQLQAMPPPLPAGPPAGEALDARGCILTGDTRAFCATRAPGITFTRTWTLDPLAPNKFEVSAKWKGADGRPHSVVLYGER